MTPPAPWLLRRPRQPPRFSRFCPQPPRFFIFLNVLASAASALSHHASSPTPLQSHLLASAASSPFISSPSLKVLITSCSVVKIVSARFQFPNMLNLSKHIQPRPNRASLGGMDLVDPKRKSSVVWKLLFVAALVAFCLFLLKQSSTFTTPSQFSIHEEGVTHVLVMGGAGYIGSHAALCLLKDNYRVTIVDNLSRGNLAAVRILQEFYPEPGRLQFIYADLGDAKAMNTILDEFLFGGQVLETNSAEVIRVVEEISKLEAASNSINLIPKSVSGWRGRLTAASLDNDTWIEFCQF